MKRYELTEIKAIAYGDIEAQDAILVHDREYGFHDQDNIIFDAELDALIAMPMSKRLSRAIIVQHIAALKMIYIMPFKPN